MRYFLTFLLCAGCTTIDYSQKDPTWPEHMMTIEHRVSWLEIIKKCSKYTPWYLWPPIACTEWNKNLRECHIYTFFDDKYIQEHERAHCQGYIKHIGED